MFASLGNNAPYVAVFHLRSCSTLYSYSSPLISDMRFCVSRAQIITLLNLSSDSHPGTLGPSRAPDYGSTSARTNIITHQRNFSRRRRRRRRSFFASCIPYHSLSKPRGYDAAITEAFHSCSSCVSISFCKAFRFRDTIQALTCRLVVPVYFPSLGSMFSSWLRPDGALCLQATNLQRLSVSCLFTCRSLEGYFSEDGFTEAWRPRGLSFTPNDPNGPMFLDFLSAGQMAPNCTT
jgi:hypothetical protein